MISGRFFRPKVFLCLFWVALFGRQVFWALSLPIFNGPDEPIHLQMVACLDRYGLAYYESKTDQCMRSLTRALYLDWFSSTQIIGKADKQSDFTSGGSFAKNEVLIHGTDLNLTADPETAFDKLGITASASYGPVYYYAIAKVLSVVRVFLRLSIVDYVYVIRIVSSCLFYLPTMLSVYLIAHHLSKDPKFAALAVTLVSLHPYLTFFGSITTNDLGAMLFSVMCVAAAIRYISLPTASVFWFMMSSLLLISTKQSGGLLVLACSVAITALIAFSNSRGKLKKCAPIWVALSLNMLVLFEVFPRVLGSLDMRAIPSDFNLRDYLKLIYSLVFRWAPVTEILGAFGWYEVRYPPVICYMFSSMCYILYLISLGLRAYFGRNHWLAEVISAIAGADRWNC